MTYSTLVNFHPGDQVTIFGFTAGTSTLTWDGTGGAAGFEGATAHSELNGAGTGINASLTFTGIDLPTAAAELGMRPEELRRRLAGWTEESWARAVLTGASSAEAYVVMAREPVQSFYCTDIDEAVTSLGSEIRETDRFANVTLLETRDDFVYFDRRPGLVASPIQAYLELVKGDTRERETADQVRRVILGALAQASRQGG